ncbi:UNVERIFIED_ORG: hypothetical protein ABRZ91_000914 [Heyndrickxia coagulans]
MGESPVRFLSRFGAHGNVLAAFPFTEKDHPSPFGQPAV